MAVLNCPVAMPNVQACPGKAFALLALKLITARYLTELKLTPTFTKADIPQTSVGAIARSETPCIVKYQS